MMNKQRIAELREKSKPTVENNNGLGLWNNGLVNDWYEQWFENFAELIVEECAAQCWTVSELESRGFVVSECTKRIRKHFGVE
jgi:hypothetical protein